MGRIGADLLLNTVMAPEAARRQRTIRVPEDLVVRASTAPPPAAPSTRPAAQGR
jgi:DNA-binding LacI/PurR family transcriptional regulator